METDVQHKVHQTSVPKTRPLMPIFEAVVNSIQAIQDARVESGRITVNVLRRDPRSGDQTSLPGSDKRAVDGFRIVDNGCGFDSANWRSFNTAESSHKRARGAKGVGRFLWLSAFRNAHVVSVYQEAGVFYQREFLFSADIAGGVKEANPPTECVATHSQTTVELLELNAELGANKLLPRDASRIARAIMDHCVGYLLDDACPVIEVVDDDGEAHVVNELFAADAEGRLERRFEISSHTFKATLIKSRVTGGDARHRVRLYADRREVKNYPLSEDLPEMPARPRRDQGGRQWVADVYVSSQFLDENVDQERSRFKFETIDSENEELFPEEVTFRRLRAAVAKEVRELLVDLIGAAQDKWQAAVRSHIEQRSPRYSVLFKIAEDRLRTLPMDLTPARLEGELAAILLERRERLETSLAREIDAANPIAAHIEKLLKEVHDIQRHQLAEYVVRRHAVLSELKRMLGRDATGKRPFEAVLHDIIFPRGATDRSIDPESTNLWVIDERLALSDEILSDCRVDDTDLESPHPDLVAYDRIVAVADGARPRSVVVFEFKQPGRDDYGRGLKKDPVAQLQDQVWAIRKGSFTTPNGVVRSIERTIPIYAYLVADATSSLRTHLQRAGWTPAPDGQSHISFDVTNHVVYQHITWMDLLDASSQRHRAFFERLHLPLP